MYGEHIFLCAVISAKQLVHFQKNGVYYPEPEIVRYDSHVSYDGLKWVMLKPELIVPLCVIYSEEDVESIWPFREAERLRNMMKRGWKELCREKDFLYQWAREVIVEKRTEVESEIEKEEEVEQGEDDETLRRL